MTPTDEATFIALWQQGLSHDAMAQRLGLPWAPSSRAPIACAAASSAPAAGGASPGRGPGAAGQHAPVQRPVQPQTPVQCRVSTPVQCRFDTGAVQRLDRLEDELQGLRLLVQSVVDRLDHPPVQTPVQITTLPPYPKGKAVRWNLWILDAIGRRSAPWPLSGTSLRQLVQEPMESPQRSVTIAALTDLDTGKTSLAQAKE